MPKNTTSIYLIYIIYYVIKTIRLSEDNHRRLIKLQGQIQADNEEATSMDDTIDVLVTSYEINKKKIR
jgi:hypothetical protein